MLTSAPTPSEAELVIGLVGPIGTNLNEVATALVTAFRDVRYNARIIRLSRLLEGVPGNEDLPRPGHSDYHERRMNAGDDLCRDLGTGDAVAGLGVAAIRARRRMDGDERNQARRYAWIINSLKRPEEVHLLRHAYGRRFVLLGVTAPREERLAGLVEQLRDQAGSFVDAGLRSKAESLLERDEKDVTDPFGQHVRDTFKASDVFLEVRRGSAGRTQEAARRTVELLFARPFVTPTQDEQSMFHAQAAALQSSAAGRQVGAVITDAAGQLLTTGTNEVPRPGGGMYWPGHGEDHRDFAHGRDYNDQIAVRLAADMLDRLSQAGWFDEAHHRAGTDLVREALENNGPLTGARMMDVLEFGRIVHAEMAALMEASRRGVQVVGGTLYATTYPCHMCARLIIASGIRRVVYIDPYPKSLVPEMYRDMIDSGESRYRREDRVRFDGFTGVAPVLFPDVFAAVGRTRQPDGTFAPWNATTALPRLVGSLSEADAAEASVVVNLGARLANLRAPSR